MLNLTHELVHSEIPDPITGLKLTQRVRSVSVSTGSPMKQLITEHITHAEDCYL